MLQPLSPIHDETTQTIHCCPHDHPLIQSFVLERTSELGNFGTPTMTIIHQSTHHSTLAGEIHGLPQVVWTHQGFVTKITACYSVTSREDRDTTATKDQTNGSQSEARFLSPGKGLGPVTTLKEATEEGISENARVVLTHLREVGVMRERTASSMGRIEM